jgi:hypothetical protein
LALDGGEWPDLGSCFFTPGTFCVGGWVGFFVDLDVVAENKICICQEQNRYLTTENSTERDERMIIFRKIQRSGCGWL